MKQTITINGTIKGSTFSLHIEEVPLTQVDRLHELPELVVDAYFGALKMEIPKKFSEEEKMAIKTSFLKSR